MVIKTGKGTRAWTEIELDTLKQGNIPKGYQGHHINSVKGNESMAGDPNNIAFLTRPEHFSEHLFNWRNPTSGALIDRSLAIGVVILNTLDSYSLDGIIMMGAGTMCAQGDPYACGQYQNMGGEVSDPNAI